MSLLKESSTETFDPAAIHKGDLVRAQYHTWPEPRNGIVTKVEDAHVIVLFLPGLGNVSAARSPALRPTRASRTWSFPATPTSPSR